MKIGILTLPLHTNYGGILQAYALQTVLERMGHEVTEINIKPHSKFGLIGRAFLSPLKKSIIRIIRFILLPQRKRYSPDRYTSNFIKNNIHRTWYYSLENVRYDKYDAIVVGSDQVWRDLYWKKSFHLPIENAFLSFTQGQKLKRISYAASFGLDTWQWDEPTSSRLRVLSHSFDAVSVREQSGISLCHDYLNLKAELVLDPTLLLTKDDYNKLLIKGRQCHNHCCMSYILDLTKEKEALVNKVAKELGIQIYVANNPNAFRTDIPPCERIQPPIEDWLQGFNDADFVITDSFHACVFSIIYNVPFIAIGNAERGLARFKSLLKLTGQDFRLVTDLSNFKITNEQRQLPNCNLELLRHKSLAFLSNHLS